MTLGFSTHWPKDMPEHLAGRPTEFIQKIWESLLTQVNKDLIIDYWDIYNQWDNKFVGTEFCKYWNCGTNTDGLGNHTPKHHTIRFLTERQAELWSRPKRVIHFVINNRTENRFQFAPVVERGAFQRIEFDFSGSKPLLTVQDYHIKDFVSGVCHPENTTISQNDGFESVEDFFAYFTPEVIAWQSALGKKPYIIHWTDLKY